MPAEGQTAINRRTGERAVYKGGQWVKLTPGGKPQVQEASMRSRMDIGLAPMVSGHERMTSTERKGNPFGLKDNADNAAAKVMSDMGFSFGGNDFYPLEGLAKKVGGTDFQDYEQAAAQFESQLMPIMSGAAVSPSEAKRQIRAALPAVGDDPATLQAKSRQRAMMLNGAAKARGLPLPYPDVDTWGVNTERTGGGGTGVRRFNPQTGRIE